MTELPRYRKILVAVDGSDLARSAARHAVALARQAGASLVAVYVVDSHLAFRLGIHQNEALRELRRDGERELTAVGKLAGSVGVEVETDLRDGRPGQAIVEQLERCGADLVVLGSHGQGGLGELLLGSVSQYVLHHADVPVCIVRPPRAGR